MKTVVCLLLVLVAATAAAVEPPPPTVNPTTPEQFERSRTEYAEGAQAYERGDYDVALRHFQAAYDLAPSPEFWFNIGRCHERLGRWAEAATAYDRYLAGKPTVDDAVQIRERISDLKLRAHEAARLSPPPPAPAPAPAPLPQRPSLRVPALVMLGVTVALAATATGVYLSEWSDYEMQRNACMARCSSAELDGLRTRVTSAQVAGGVLFGLAGAALVADVILWIADARRPHGERRLALAGAGALEVRF